MEEDINGYLTGSHVGKPRATEKSLYGEVFTPVSVVDRMLAMLPASVWRRADQRWCDPACGIGHFPLKAIYGGPGYPGLLTGLSSAFPARGDALKHILENMLWCYDINGEHTATLRNTFKKLCSDQGVVASAHVITGDFLESSGADKPFDVIMGNPPYNSGGTKRVGEKRLHVRFTEVALSKLSPTGHLLFVCPPNYREAGSSMNALFLSGGRFRSVWMIGPNETHRLFKVQTRVDCFLWSRGYSGDTHVVDEYGTESHVELDLTRHVPNFGFSVFAKLRACPAAPLHAFRSAEATTISCEKSGFRRDGGGRFPTLHLIVEEGRKVLRRVRPHTLQNIPKLILNGLGIPYVFYDKAGKYGVTQTPVVITEPSPDLVAFMKSPLFYFIVWGLRITGNNNMPYLFQDVPADFGAGIKFTAEERALIDSFRVPEFADRDNHIVCSSGRTTRRRR